MSAIRMREPTTGKRWRLMLMAGKIMTVGGRIVNEHLMNHEPKLPASAVAVLAPLDRVRWMLLKLLGQLARPVIRCRELRVMVAGVGVVMFSLAATLISPFWLLALGPVVLGVPHLVADMRYLVLRPGLHRRRILWLPVGVPLLLAGTANFTMTSGLVACAVMALLAHGAWIRKGTALGVIAALMAGAWVVGDVAALIFAHAHNFIAVMLWWCWRPQSERSGVSFEAGEKTVAHPSLFELLRAFFASLGRRRMVPLLFLAASSMIAAGWLEPWARGFAWQPARLGPDYHLSFLAPGVAEPWALRLVLLFAFAQSVHYGVWLRLIPEDDRPQETPRTFRASARALQVDMGVPLLAGALLIALGVALWSVFDLAAARENYLRLALFHGYLELIAATWLYVERPAGVEGAA